MNITMPVQIAAVRTEDGEYSSVLRPDGVVETLFFRNGEGDGNAEVAGMSSLSALAQRHREDHAKRHEYRPNGRAYVLSAINRYIPAHRGENGTVRVYMATSGEWTAKPVQQDSFIPDGTTA